MSSNDLALEEAILLRLRCSLLGEGCKLVHLAAAHMLDQAYVLSGLIHRVDIRQPGRGLLCTDSCLWFVQPSCDDGSVAICVIAQHIPGDDG